MMKNLKIGQDMIDSIVVVNCKTVVVVVVAVVDNYCIAEQEEERKESSHCFRKTVETHHLDFVVVDVDEVEADMRSLVDSKCCDGTDSVEDSSSTDFADEVEEGCFDLDEGSVVLVYLL